MFAQSRPVPFHPYGRKRARWHVPRWLLLLLVGIATGAAGVVVVQERYLAPRLSADASEKLRGAYARADAERNRLQAELGATAAQRDTALADHQKLAGELTASRATTEQLRDELGTVVAALPADPRGGSVEVRAARFAVKDGTLAYDLVLTRERVAGKPVAGVVQLVVAGESGRGSTAPLTLTPLPVSIGSHQVVRGSADLPEGFKPRRTTVQVLDHIGGKTLGMRVLPVRQAVASR
jgi:hypothetical protein